MSWGTHSIAAAMASENDRRIGAHRRPPLGEGLHALAQPTQRGFVGGGAFQLASVALDDRP